MRGFSLTFRSCKFDSCDISVGKYNSLLSCKLSVSRFINFPAIKEKKEKRKSINIHSSNEKKKKNEKSVFNYTLKVITKTNDILESSE